MTRCVAVETHAWNWSHPSILHRVLVNTPSSLWMHPGHQTGSLAHAHTPHCMICYICWKWLNHNQLLRCVCRSCPGRWSLLEDRDNDSFPLRYWDWPLKSILPHSHTDFPPSRSTSCVPRSPPPPATSSTLSDKYCRCCKSPCMRMLHWACPSVCSDT